MSTFKEAIQSGLEEYLQALTRAIEGLTPTEIRWQATPHTNHIAWLVWHMARVEDGWVSLLRRAPTVWQAAAGQPASTWTLRAPGLGRQWKRSERCPRSPCLT